MNNLTLVIPAKNESESLPLVLKEIFNLKLGLKIKVCLEKKDIQTRGVVTGNILRQPM